MSAFGEQFLHSPALFPARLAGETWGEAVAGLDLPGGPYRITGLTNAQRESLTDRYEDRVTPAESAAIELVIYRAPATDFRAIDTRGWEYALDYQPSESAADIAGMRLMSRIDLGRQRAAIWTSVDDRAEFWGVVENVLRPLVALRLLATGGLLVHSAGVAFGQKGFLFAGPSGAGKSTVARLAFEHRHPVLSDDLNAVVRDGDGFALAPLPFTGDLVASQIGREAVRLRSIVRLDKGETESIRRMGAAESVSLLIRSAPYINRDPHRAQLLLDRAGELVAAAARAVLTFRRDGDIWPILESL